MLPLNPDNLNLSRHRCTAHESSLADMRALVLDNGIFTLSILPEFGGRLCSLFYRPLNLELLATEFIHGHGPMKTINVHGGWCAAFPSLLADGEIISRQIWEAEISEQSEERVTARLWCTVDRVSYMLDGNLRVTPGTITVQRYVRLVAGEASVTVEDVITNLNAWPAPTTWSGVISLRAQAGDRAVLPIEQIQIQRGDGPTGNELDFGKLKSTPFQAVAYNLQQGWMGFCPSSAPIDFRISFPNSILPHAIIFAQQDAANPAKGFFRFQPLVTDGPIANDARGNALVLQPRNPVKISVRLEAGANILEAGEFNRPGLHLAEAIIDQQVSIGRLAVWRLGKRAIALKTPRHLALIVPIPEEENLLTPDDLPAADLLLCEGVPPILSLQRMTQRSSSRFVGPAMIRQIFMKNGVADDRSVALSPGARFDLPGLGVLATPVRNTDDGEKLGYLIQSDQLSLYYTGSTQFLGEFGPIGEQFHPQLLFLTLSKEMTLDDSIHAAKILQPRLVVPLGEQEEEAAFIQRCRDMHMPFAVQTLHAGEGRLFDGWHMQALNSSQEK